MKRVIGYKNYICFVLVFLIVVTGICLCESRMDSSFALHTYDSGGATLNRVSPVLQNTVMAVKENSSQDVINNRGGRTMLYKALRCGKIHDGNMQVVEKQYDIIHFMQELDIRLCRTDNLTQVFNVLYIHHQDGVKGAGLFLL